MTVSWDRVVDNFTSLRKILPHSCRWLFGLPCCLLFCSLFFTAIARAELPALIRNSTVIYQQPSLQSKPLGRVSRVSKVIVVGKTGTQWFKVKLPLANGASLDGWVLKSNLFRPQETSPSGAPALQSKAKAKTAAPKEKSLIDTLLEQKNKKKEPAKKPTVRYKDDDADDGKSVELLKGRLELGAQLGYRVNSYSVGDANNTIAYDIPGLFFGAAAEYQVWKFEAIRLGLGLRAGFDYEMKSYTVELIDDGSPGTQISSTDASGTTTVMDFSFRPRYSITDSPKSVQVIGQVGYLLSSTSMDDATLRNLPLNLFTNSDYTHIYVGLGLLAPFTLADTIAGFELTGQYFLSSEYSESVSSGATNVSGQNPTGATGYNVEVGFFWHFTEHLVAHMKFVRKVEGADFTGAGQRLSNSNQVINLTDASVTDTWNGGLFGVTYEF